MERQGTRFWESLPKPRRCGFERVSSKDGTEANHHPRALGRRLKSRYAYVWRTDGLAHRYGLTDRGWEFIEWGFQTGVYQETEPDKVRIPDMGLLIPQRLQVEGKKKGRKWPIGVKGVLHYLLADQKGCWMKVSCWSYEAWDMDSNESPGNTRN